MISNMVLVQKMGEIVADAESRVLPELQQAAPNILGLNYIYGSLEEIRRRLLEMSRTPDEQLQMYPLVMLLTDISIAESKGGYPGTVTLQMCIVYPAVKEARPEEKYRDVLTPILNPIHDALLRAIVDSRCFVLSSVRNIQYTRREVLDMKLVQLADGTFDRVDGIELQNLKLTISDLTKLKSITEVQGLL